ncbi:MAG: hypothetical protein FE78DRAFT_312961 [Acidomyces sp. 'richmondensis']|nr:MAG: hypothetical protein FE78DRAFT_312961 [Acidomyces sp. 'richmondensis']
MGGGKKRKQILETPEELVNRPWCYYCNRGFDNLNTLCDHQKKVHMRCELCRKMMTTIGGLKVHLSQVHKETLTEVPNHVEGRNDLVSEVFGMYGIPADVMEQHKERVYAAYNKEQAEYRKKTGNPLPGTSHHKEVMAMMQTQQANKKQKVEDDINAAKARVAELKARKLAEKLAAKQAATPPDINKGQTQPASPLPLGPTNPNDAVDKPDLLPPSVVPSAYGVSHNPQEPALYGFNSPQQPVMQTQQPPFGAQYGMQMYASPSNYMLPASASPPTVPYPSYHSPQQSIASHNLQSAPRVHPTSSTPPISKLGPTLPPPGSGLPQRPAGDVPKISKEEIANLHRPGIYASIPNNFAQQPPASITATESTITKDDVQDLIDSVTNENPKVPSRNETPEKTAPATDGPPSLTAGSKEKKNLTKRYVSGITNDDISLEERKASSGYYEKVSQDAVVQSCVITLLGESDSIGPGQIGEKVGAGY